MFIKGPDMSKVKKPKFIFGEEKENYVKIVNRIVVINEDPNPELKFVRFELTFVDNKTLTAKFFHSGPPLKAMRDLITNPEIMAIEPRWGNRVNKYGHIYLFKDKQMIRWCWSPIDELTDQVRNFH